MKHISGLELVRTNIKNKHLFNKDQCYLQPFGPPRLSLWVMISLRLEQQHWQQSKPAGKHVQYYK